MAQRRMFSPKIVSSDAFLDMALSTQALYFHLGMNADDDGFVNPRGIMRLIGASEDELKVLIAKRFILPFESGVIVLKHWKINNEIKKDRYHATIYQEEKNRLTTKDNGVYTERLQNVSKMDTEVRLGKVIKEAIAKPIAFLSAPSKAPLVLVQTDNEGKEKAPRQQRVLFPKALALRDKLYTILEADNGVRSTPHMGDYARITEALKHLTEQQVVEMFEEAVGAKTVHTVREVFTARNIDIYRQENV